MSFTYSTYVIDLANMLPVPTADAGYVTVLPNIIDDAEQRIYRDLDLLNTQVTDTSGALVTGSNTFTISSSYLVVDRINIITPFGTSNPDLGTRNTLLRTSTHHINFTYPNSTGSAVPLYFSMSTQTSGRLGPWPDKAYSFEVVGSQRPAPLSNSNQTTLLSQYFPDLFMAASMVFASGYLKNFGAGVDDPQMAANWEGHYKNLLESARIEEARKKSAGEGWSTKQPSSIATPPRT